jgi:hypothetical protein
MSEAADNSTSTTAPVAATAAPTPPPAVVATEERPRHSRITQVAAWVGIVAGVTFVVAVIFFSGFILGKHSDGGGHHRGGPDREISMFHRGGPPMGPPHIFFPGGGPGGEGGSGFGPGFQGPQQGQGPGPGNAPGTPPRP